MSDVRITHYLSEAEKALQFLLQEFAKLQTGRANAAIVEHIAVEAYGQRQELRTVAGITVQDARTIVIQPWDRSILQTIEKAIQQSNLGIAPVNDGSVLRMNLPPLTQERRQQLQKVVHQLAEDARISVRKHRQEAHDKIKESKEEDVRRTLEAELQKHVDAYNGKIDAARKKKEEELMKI
jgi:ribosome recycling factor